MTFDNDIACLIKVCERDPSFQTVDTVLIERHLHDLRARREPEDFLLAAMRLLALPGNGHTRVIPNRAAKVMPMRFVALGENFILTDAAYGPIGEKLLSVNGIPIDDIAARAAPYLAGTPARQRVVGPILLAWPAALRRLKVPFEDHVSYGFAKGSTEAPITDVVPAQVFYPQNEHGRAAASWVPDAFAKVTDWPDVGVSITLPSFFDPDEMNLPLAISKATKALKARSGSSLLLDVRGNTGGDFLLTLPLIDAITAHASSAPVAVMVDKFTFSAAIVFVAILKHRLGHRLRLVGEGMGDGSRFFAEGGLMELPDSGGAVRHSTALHDWEHGVPDSTTPNDIAEQMVPAGRLAIDHPYAAAFADRDAVTIYTDILRGIG